LRCHQEDAQGGDAEGADPFEGKEVYSMPGFDRTGPKGEGAMTGRGQGRCNPYGSSFGNGNPVGRGSGQGRGRGRGLGKGFGRGSGRYSRRVSRNR
jgi:hypothetical protein